MRSYALHGGNEIPASQGGRVEYGPSTIGEALDEFLDEVRITRASSTVYSYQQKLRGRLDLAAPLTSLDSRACRSLILAECRSKAPGTARTLYGALGSFCAFIARRGYLPVSPMRDVSPPRVPESGNKALTDRQLDALRDACETDQERLMLALFLSTGCRRSARWADIDWELGCLRILNAKGGKTRRVSLDDEALGLLKQALQAPTNALLGEPFDASIAAVPAAAVDRSLKFADAYVHHRRDSTTILGWTSKAVYYRFKRLVKRAGLPAVHPHQMRHSYFTDRIRRGMSPLAAQTIGGWSDQRMLMRYSKASVEDAALAEARRFGR